ERLKAECANTEQLYTQLKMERLADLARQSQEKAIKMGLVEPDLETKGCQTDLSMFLNEFCTRPPKNFVFVYNVVVLTTQQSLPRAVSRSESSSPKLKSATEGEEVEIKLPGVDVAAASSTASSVHGEASTLDGALQANNEPTTSVPAEQRAALTPRGTPTQASRVSLRSKISKAEEIPESSNKSEKPASNNVVVIASTAILRKPIEGPPSLTLDVKDAEMGKNLANPSSPTVHVATSHCSSPIIRSNSVARSFEAKLPKSPSPPVSRSMLENAEIQNFSSCDSSSVEPNAEDLGLILQDSFLDDQTNDIKASVTPAPVGPSPPSRRSDLFVKLKHALSTVATQEQTQARYVSPEETVKTAHKDSDQECRQSSGQEHAGATKDPGFKEFQKRSWVSVSSRAFSSKPMEAAGGPFLDSLNVRVGSPKETRPGPEKSFSQAIGLCATRAQCTTPGVIERTLPTPLDEFRCGSGLLLNSPSEKDSLSEELHDNLGASSEEESRIYETSSEFHASLKNVMRAAVEKRTTDVQPSTSKTSGRNTAKTDQRKKRKKSKRKRDTLRRAGSPPTPSTSSEGSLAEALARHRGRKSVASFLAPTLSEPSSRAMPVLPYSTGKSSQSSDALTKCAHMTGASSGVSSSGTSTTDDRKLLQSLEKTTSEQSTATQPTQFTSGLRSISTVQSPATTHRYPSGTATDTSPSDEELPQGRQFLSDAQNKETLEGNKRSFFECLSSAGYLPFDDATMSRRAPVVVDSSRQYLSDDDNDALGNAHTLVGTIQPGRRKQADSSNRSYVVQRAQSPPMPFPREIMKTLLPSFVNLDDCVRVDKIMTSRVAIASNPAMEHLGMTGLDRQAWTELRNFIASREPKPVNWEEMQSCLLPAFYTFSGSQVQNNRGRCCDLSVKLNY
ncbi:unnamed protein product, partial [Ixodes hexagonus]